MEEQDTKEVCPYRCNSEGRYFDRRTRKWADCPTHRAEREKAVRNGVLPDGSSLPLEMGFTKRFMDGTFVLDSVIPRIEQDYIDPDSLTALSERAEGMAASLLLGTVPEASVCFGLGVKGKVDAIAYPLMAAAYKGALGMPQFVSATEYRLRSVDDDWSQWLSDCIRCKFMVVLVNEGCSKADLYAIKGLMQMRASKGNPTVFVTTWSVEACSTLLSGYDEESLFQADSVFVRYRNSGQQSNYVGRITGVDNGQVMGSGAGGLVNSAAGKGSKRSTTMGNLRGYTK